MTNTNKAKVMITLEEYAENCIDFSTYIDESFWERTYNTEKAFDWLLHMAQLDGYTISDELTVDYDSVLWDIYTNTEKGLS